MKTSPIWLGSVFSQTTPEPSFLSLSSLVPVKLSNFQFPVGLVLHSLPSIDSLCFSLGLWCSSFCPTPTYLAWTLFNCDFLRKAFSDPSPLLNPSVRDPQGITYFLFGALIKVVTLYLFIFIYWLSSFEAQVSWGQDCICLAHHDV